MRHDNDNLAPHTELLLRDVLGDLDPEQARALRARLDADPALAAEHARLADAYDTATRTLDALDAAPVPSSLSVQAVVRNAMTRRQQQAEESQRAADAARRSRPEWRIPPWVYPFAAAAVFLFGLATWYVQTADRSLNAPTTTTPVEISLLPGTLPDAGTTEELAQKSTAEESINDSDLAMLSPFAR